MILRQFVVSILAIALKLVRSLHHQEIDFSDCSDTGSELFSTSSEQDCSLLSNSLPCSTASSWHNVFGKEIHHCFVCMFNEFKGHLFIHEHL